MKTTTLTLEEAIDLIAQEVVAAQGCKATELAARSAFVHYDFPFSMALEEAVKRGRIREVEYSIPGMEWRAKSFLLPQGSNIFIVGPTK